MPAGEGLRYNKAYWDSVLGPVQLPKSKQEKLHLLLLLLPAYACLVFEFCSLIMTARTPFASASLT